MLQMRHGVKVSLHFLQHWIIMDTFHHGLNFRTPLKSFLGQIS